MPATDFKKCEVLFQRLNKARAQNIIPAIDFVDDAKKAVAAAQKNQHSPTLLPPPGFEHENTNGPLDALDSNRYYSRIFLNY